MGWFTSSKTDFSWEELKDSEALRQYVEKSEQVPVLFFKHSTRCSISAMAKTRFEREWDLDLEKCICVYLDLIQYRPISNEMAELLKVVHQSPQAILVVNKEVLHHASHNAIDAQEFISFV
jgi:bacillithiol system protein YtxJ